MEKKKKKTKKYYEGARSEMTHEQEISLTHDLPPINVVSSLKKYIKERKMEKKKTNRKKRLEIEDLAHEIADAMYKAADYLEKHPQSRKTVENISKAVKKYLSSRFSPDDDITLYNDLMDALEETGADKINGEDDGVGYKY